MTATNQVKVLFLSPKQFFNFLSKLAESNNNVIIQHNGKKLKPDEIGDIKLERDQIFLVEANRYLYVVRIE